MKFPTRYYRYKDLMLPCGYSVTQCYIALKRAWRGYKTAINKDEDDLAVRYASRIQKIQREMGGPVASFPWLNMSKAGEDEDLAHFIAGELTGDEPVEEKKEEITDPLYSCIPEMNQGLGSESTDYEFQWSSRDLEKLKRFS